MLDVVAQVNRLVPGLLLHTQPSVACVCTTQPKYLVFDGDPARPACIVEYGDEVRLTRTGHILTTLRARMPPGGVAHSLCCTSLPDGTFVHIQAGLPGVPWFRLADTLTTTAAWEELLARAVTAMGHLHAAVRDVPAWIGTVDLSAELGRQEALCRRHGTLLDDQALARIVEWRKPLAATGPVQAWWQHGDFSLNNLLVSPGSVAVIDFDEFGLTQVPLHDAFGLALSLTLSQENRCPLPRGHCLNVCAASCLKEAGLAPEHVPGLLMHHLLWRVNQCYGVARRTRLRHILLGWIAELAAAPEAFLET
jgi:hypothetical protein